MKEEKTDALNERRESDLGGNFIPDFHEDSEIMFSEMEDMSLKEKIRTTFSKVGWAYFLFLLVGILAQFIVGGIYGGIKEGLGIKFESQLLEEFINYALTLLPMYVIGLPLLQSFLKVLPKDETPGETFGFLRMLKFFFISLPIMYFGNMISLGFMSLVENMTGKKAVSNISEMIGNSNPWMLILFVVIIGPIIEEVIFRKILIDKTVKFGEKNAVILSAIMFGLFHMNLFQFFYATALGFVFGYIYAKSRRLRYTIILHMIINFMGSVIVVLLGGEGDNGVLKMIQEGKMDQIPAEQFLQLALLSTYSIFVVVASIIGIVFIILNVRKMKFDEAGLPIEKNVLRSLTYGNLGISFFFGLCIVMTVITTFMQLQ